MALSKPKICSGDEIKSTLFYRDVFIEFLISMFLLMFITFSLTTKNSDVYSPNTLHIGLMVGFVIFGLIEGYGHFSGGHMNPIISFAFFVDGRISFIRMIAYTVVQCLGGACGSAAVYGLCSSDIRDTFQPFMPAAGIGPVYGIVIEVIFTFNLAYTAISASDSTAHRAAMPAFPTAFCVGTAIMAVGSWTGACLNPIVALGPAVISWNFKYHWVYWVGNYTGALIAALMYRVYLMARPTNEKEKIQSLDEKPLKSEHSEEEITDLVKQIIKLASNYQNDNLFTACKHYDERNEEALVITSCV